MAENQRWWLYDPNQKKAVGPFSTKRLKSIKGFDLDTFVAPDGSQDSGSWKKGGDYDEVNAPQLLDKSLWETSGHWGWYRETMFAAQSAGESTRSASGSTADSSSSRCSSVRAM